MKKLRLAAAGLTLTVLALPAAAAAAVQLGHVDASAYPTIRASIVSPAGAAVTPAITENGQPVAGLEEQNLGRIKAIATLIDRSQSMRGKPLDDAVAAARSFVGAKNAADQLAVVTAALVDVPALAGGQAQGACQKTSEEPHGEPASYGSAVHGGLSPPSRTQAGLRGKHQ